LTFIVSKPAADVLRQSMFIYHDDLGVRVPEGVTLTPEIQQEIEAFLRSVRIPVKEAATSVLAAVLEQQGISVDSKRAVH